MGGHGGHGFDYHGVWSPSGGWHADPKHWRRNTAFAFVGIIAVAIPIFMASAKLEQRPIAPTRPIPSQIWSKNLAKDEN